jgi:hypothetical protein
VTKLVFRNGRLYWGVWELIPAGNSEFHTPQAVITFGNEQSPNRPSGLITLTRGEQTQLQPISTVTVSPGDLAESTGEFYSSELDVTYSISSTDSRLVLTRKKYPDTRLIPFGNNVFFDLDLGSVCFVRDERHQMKSFMVNRAQA